MLDFNLPIYTKLLSTLKKNNYKFYPIFLYDSINSGKSIILKHDVDRSPANSIITAKIEKDLGIRGTYYFRIVKESFNISAINKIVELGHEIGYHYEDVALVNKYFKVKSKKDEELLLDLAYESFCKNLEKMRQVVVIKTIAMHGSPKSAFDNKIIWKKYSYKNLGILYEPYLDVNWNEFGYLTDTGRRWDGDKYNVRDKVNSKFNFNFKTTQQFIEDTDDLPDKLMITIHPERWTDNWLKWSRNLVFQNMKNAVKMLLVKLMV